MRKVKGDDQLEITLHEVISDVTHTMDFDADRLSKDGVEADLQVALADTRSSAARASGSSAASGRPTSAQSTYARDEADGWIDRDRAHRHDRRRRAALACLERIRLDPARPPAAASSPPSRSSPRPACCAEIAPASPGSRSTSRNCAASASRRSRVQGDAVLQAHPDRPTLRRATFPGQGGISERGPPLSRCSHEVGPCQVPVAQAPAGHRQRRTTAPSSEALMSAGMSSAPSIVWSSTRVLGHGLVEPGLEVVADVG